MTRLTPLRAVVSKVRRLRMGLSTFLAGVTVLSLGMGIYAERSRQQQIAVARIRELRGTVVYSYAPSDEEKLRRHHEAIVAARAQRDPPLYDDRPAAPRWLVAVCGEDYFATVVEASFGGTLATDEDVIACLTRLPHLKRVRLSNMPNLTNRGLTNLPKLKRLESLNLSQNRWEGGSKPSDQLSDDALEVVASLTALMSLDLENNNFTDAGLNHLCQLSDLQSLDIGLTQVTTAGLHNLRGLSRLRTLEHSLEIDDKFLASIKPFKQLGLSLHLGSKVSDDGLLCLRNFSELKELYINGAAVTNRCMSVLASLPLLETF